MSGKSEITVSLDDEPAAGLRVTAATTETRQSIGQRLTGEPVNRSPPGTCTFQNATETLSWQDKKSRNPPICTLLDLLVNGDG